MKEPPTQQSQLLRSLFEHVDEDQRITVLQVGPALQDTLDFFSRYRCKLHFVDIFAELPIVDSEDSRTTLAQQFHELLQFPAGTHFDICLFWDLFNYLDSDAIGALLMALRPYLKDSSLAHGFAVHNLSTAQGNYLYGIKNMDTLSLRSRTRALPGYAPHSQRQLKDRLTLFRFERSVLLSDSRLELLLHTKLL